MNLSITTNLRPAVCVVLSLLLTTPAWAAERQQLGRHVPGGLTVGSKAAPMAAQMPWRGAWQDAQEQPVESLAARLDRLPLNPGANVLLGMGHNEPTIAADPNNPLRVAAATYLGIRVSTNGGVGFEPRANITAPNGYSTAHGGDSSVGYDSQGRLFWTFLLLNTNVGGFDVFIVQCDPNTGAILPGYPVNVTAGASVAGDGVNHSHDKSWLAVDASATSPFRDRLYVVWTDFSSSGTVILTTSSANQGATWRRALALSSTSEGFVWPSQNTVATNGDVYVSYHSQTGWTSGDSPDGVSGKIFVSRSINAGASYSQKRVAYAAGRADITFNVQSGDRTIPRTQFWLQGSVQPRILADPNIPGRIYVIANDQPNATHLADVYIVTSTNNGGTWSAPARVDSEAAGTFHVMPSAAIDPVSGDIVATYYDNRNGQTNSSGNFLLDVFATTSADGGATFTPDFQINTASFDPDLNARCRFGPSGCGDYDTVNTLRIGEYNGVAIGGGVALAVWTGNNASGFQDTAFSLFSSVACTVNCPTTVTQANDAGMCGATVNYPAPTSSGGCGIVTCSPPSGSFFAVRTNTVTCASATGSSCTFNVIVNDTEPPQVTSSVATAWLWPPNHNLVNVGLTAAATDNCSDAIATSVQVFCDESQHASGDGHFRPDAEDIAPGTLRLRSACFGAGDGRVYLIVTTATDTSGNENRSCATVMVPHDRSAASIAAVKAQAAAASAFCQAHDGDAPPGFGMIGSSGAAGRDQSHLRRNR